MRHTKKICCLKVFNYWVNEKIEHLKTSQSFQQKLTVKPSYGKQNINTKFRKKMFCNLSMLTKNHKHVIKSR